MMICDDLGNWHALHLLPRMALFSTAVRSFAGLQGISRVELRKADRQEKQLPMAQLPIVQLHSYPNSNAVLDQK